AGVKGGAAMPLLREQDPGSKGKGKVARAPAILRPMLAVSRRQIEAYAKANKLTWVEDESNADTRRDRNFLRHKVLPVIGKVFPGYRVTLSRAAGHLAEADEVLSELARADAQQIALGNKIAVTGLKRLGPTRAKNLLRWLLLQYGAALPEADRLEEALRQLVHARDDAAVRVVLGTHELRRYAGEAYLLPLLADPPSGLERKWDGKRACALPELGGVLRFARTGGAGLKQGLIRNKDVFIRLRQGGEKLRLLPSGPTRSLKNLLQEARMPPWERERLPLVYCGDTLVAVPGLGAASGWQAGAGDVGWMITWQRWE
ncbi:MAG: tRNA lysidine(34) synthetase TilS, partial [Acidobacteriota bacterium]